MKIAKNTKGFTLIELLIVISIIGILAVAFLPSLLGAPAKARDTQRTSAVAKIEAFLAGKSLSTGEIPTTSACIEAAGGNDISDLIIASLPDFGGNFPIDPQADNAIPTDVIAGGCEGDYGYIYFTSGAYQAAVVTRVENPENANIVCESVDPANGDANTLSNGVTLIAGENGCFIKLIQ